MKVKTSELTGPALDWAVAKLWYSDRRVELTEGRTGVRVLRDPSYDGSAHYHWFVFIGSTAPAQAWPIIDREGIGFYKANSTRWWAQPYGGEYNAEGTTSLIAAMRCYVVYKLGDEVEIPEELVT